MTDDPIAQLRERIRATAAAADRLAGEAANGHAPHAEQAASEAQALAALFAVLRDALPPDLRQQVVDLVRQVLLLLRAVLDQVLLRLEAPPAGSADAGPPVEDIPVD
jgi:hypothetical protein